MTALNIGNLTTTVSCSPINVYHSETSINESLSKVDTFEFSRKIKIYNKDYKL